MERFYQMGSSYLSLAIKHQALLEEVLAKFQFDELVVLAKTLPYHQQASRTIYNGRWITNTRESFHLFLDRVETRPVTAHQSTIDKLALYICEACQYAVSKNLTEMLELTKKKKVILDVTNALVQSALGKHAKLLHKALCRGAKEEIDAQSDGIVHEGGSESLH